MLILIYPSAAPQIDTLSLHDALPISSRWRCVTTARDPPRRSRACTATRSPRSIPRRTGYAATIRFDAGSISDRKSTRLNSSHVEISYAVFCVKKKNDTLFGVYDDV